MKKHTINGQELPVFNEAAVKKKRLEKDVEARIGEYARKLGCLYEKFTSPNRRSVPDRLITTPRGVIGFLEVKRAGEKPTEQQALDHAERRARGCNVDWCDSVEGGRKFIDKLLELDALQFTGIDDIF